MTDETTDDATQDNTDGQSEDNQENNSTVNDEDQILTGDDTDNTDSGDKQTDDDKSSSDSDTDDDKEDDDKDSEGAPDEYEAFEMPEGVEIDQATLDEFTPLAKEDNLSQEKAQRYVDLFAKKMAEKAQADWDAWNEKVNGWTKETKEHKDFGGQNFEANAAIANKALSTIGSPELIEALKVSGLSQHPAMFQMLLKVGKEIEEGNFIPSNQQGGGQQDAASVLYPDHNKT